MSTENSHKIKLLKLMELFRTETDEEHPMTASQICETLAKRGIPVDRRTLTRDIRTLNDFGYEIMDTMVSHEKAYYLEDRSFSIPEIKVLIDAVQAASFITEQKTAELVEKIAALGGGNRAELLKRNMVRFNTRKHSNESIYYNVDSLEAAIRDLKMASFLYYDLNEHGEKVYRKGGHRYRVEPIALVFHEDNYYLICYSARHTDTSTYRVDRMTGVEIDDSPISETARTMKGQISEYTEQVFKMYHGEKTELTLSFAEHLIGVVYDKFGEGTRMTRNEDNTVTAAVTVQISPTFWGWLFQFGGDMKIVSPESAIREYRETVKLLAESLDTDLRE